ncbi:4'-phosphopantetheinyl transferase family protein [Flavobacterium subsaxonicum]|uniref:Phosphopantetheinyl transferase n=1 Tax=Flavobacterium subsaxonicum WB 4.1-42 = DSM 21790 TaxID=1121898 RepID=A0A0A2MTE8_9FLAO|nr:4'-phosphopantetheinyl transferase superfamily protein [Flavobacterium subsaxonicum]KGO94723.1 phosphopantetheinyl transferase [Flavobacterium subsaxonicum WB 4.1-42 = DSM 21790]
MIGNDVVDIIQSRKESNWQRRGFLDKLFTISEQQLINHHPDPETMVWLLWSMKESAYKIYNRQTGIRAFIPLQLECCKISQNDKGFTGEVHCKRFIFYTESEILEDIIHTKALCSKGLFNKITEVKNAAVVKDISGFPYIYGHQNKTLEPVSVSHHGRCHKVVKLL